MSASRAAIVAGGLATRMGSTVSMPKAMLPVAGKPLLFRHLEAIAAAGVRDVTICAGHRAGELATSHHDELRVRVTVEAAPLGSGGCLGACAGGEGDLLVIFGDVMADMDYAPLLAWHRAHDADATLVVHPNDHPHDSDLVETDGGAAITAIHRKPHPPQRALVNCVAAGVFVLSANFVNAIDGRGDLVHDVLIPALHRGARLVAYETDEFLKDVGTPERYAAVCAAWEGR